MSEFLSSCNLKTDLVVYAQGREQWYYTQYSDDHSLKVTWLWAGVQIPAQVTDFFILQNLKTSSRANPSPIQGVPGPFFAAVEHPECKAELTPPSIADIQNKSCTSTLPTCLHSIKGQLYFLYV
jgi:hypothetical protein